MATVTLDELFQRQVAMRGDKIALRFERDAVTYGDLDRRATRIAHGLLLVSMMTGMAPISGQAVVALYGFDRVRFVNPVLLGDTITYTSKIAGLQPKGDSRGLADVDFQICNQHQNVCVAGTIKILLHKTPGS